MKTALNLMTDEDRRQQFLREAQMMWARVLVSTLLVLTGVGVTEWYRSQTISRQLTQLEERYAPMQKLKQECIRMRTDINAMREAQQLTLRLVDTRPTTTLLGAVSAAAADTQGNVFVSGLELDAAESATNDRTAVITGVGRDNQSIALFTASLRASRLFGDVTLSSSDTSSLADDQARSFRVECKL